MSKFKDEMENLPVCRCRMCHHFQRVNFDDYRNVTNRQGFCILGQLEGSYGLYVSNSRSYDCMGYLFCDEHANITRAENGLSNDMDDFLHSIEDKRTKNCKLIQPVIDAQTEFFKQDDKYDGPAWLMALQELRRFGGEYFIKINKERYQEVYHMVSLRKTDYNKFLAQVSVEIHNRFCDCDCTEAKGD